MNTRGHLTLNDMIPENVPAGVSASREQALKESLAQLRRDYYDLLATYNAARLVLGQIRLAVKAYEADPINAQDRGWDKLAALLEVAR